MVTSKQTADHGDLVEWFTVSYRTLYLAVGAVAARGRRPPTTYVLAREQPACRATPAPTLSPSTAARFTLASRAASRSSRWGRSSGFTADPAHGAAARATSCAPGPGAAAEIAFFDGTVVHVRPGQPDHHRGDLRRIRRPSGAAWPGTSSSGEVNFQTVRRNVPGSATEVSTPTGEARTRERDDGRRHPGRGVRRQRRDACSRARRRRRPQTGEQIAAGRQRGASRSTRRARPVRKQALPGCPALLAPLAPGGDHLPRSRAAPRTLLVWKPVAGAASLPRDAGLQRRTSTGPLVDRGTGMAESHRGAARPRHAASTTGGWPRVDKDSVGGRVLGLRALHGRPARGARAPGGGPAAARRSRRSDVRTNILQDQGPHGAGRHGHRERPAGGRAGATGPSTSSSRLDKPGRQTVVIRARRASTAACSEHEAARGGRRC